MGSFTLYTSGGGIHEPTAQLARSPSPLCPGVCFPARHGDDGFRTVRSRQQSRARSKIHRVASSPARPSRSRARRPSNPARPSPTAAAYYTFPNLTAGRYELVGRAERLQEDQPLQRAARRGRPVGPRFHARDRRAHRGGDRHRRDLGAADAGRGAKVGRGEGHRAAVVLGPQPDWRPRAQGRRRRRQFQQRGFAVADQRRLQHQRRPRPTRTTSPSTARSRSARARPARPSACRTSTRSRKSRS